MKKNFLAENKKNIPPLFPPYSALRDNHCQLQNPVPKEMLRPWAGPQGAHPPLAGRRSSPSWFHSHQRREEVTRPHSTDEEAEVGERKGLARVTLPVLTQLLALAGAAVPQHRGSLCPLPAQKGLCSGKELAFSRVGAGVVLGASGPCEVGFSLAEWSCPNKSSTHSSQPCL